jgi:hypothetical protein
VYNPEFVCPYCVLKKHKETRHCMVCKRCVQSFDHHCKWINNCVGKANTTLFIVMVVWLIIECCGCVALALYVIVEYRRLPNSYRHSNEVVLLAISGCMLVITGPVGYSMVRRVRKKKVEIPMYASLSRPRGGINDIGSDTESMLLYEHEGSDATTESRKSSIM